MMEHRFENLPLILVSGQARSGTTILTHAIGAHRRIHSNLKESSIVNDIAAVLRKNLELKGRRLDLSVSPEMLALNFRRFLLHSLFPFQADGSNEVGAGNLPAVPVAISTFSSMRYENFDYLAQIFPRLIIANIYRNGIEVVASRMTHTNIGSRFDFEQHCTAWAHARDAMEWGAEKPFFVPCPHHDLLDREKTNATLRSVLAKVGLDSAEACTDFVHNNVVSTHQSSGANRLSVESKERELASRIKRSQDWTNEQKAVFERVCGETMDFFGFEIPWLAGRIGGMRRFLKFDAKQS